MDHNKSSPLRKSPNRDPNGSVQLVLGMDNNSVDLQNSKISDLNDSHSVRSKYGDINALVRSKREEYNPHPVQKIQISSPSPEKTGANLYSFQNTQQSPDMKEDDLKFSQSKLTKVQSAQFTPNQE